MMQGFASSRVRLALLFLAAIVVALVLGVASNPPTSAAQTGTGYGPQNVPDQVIEPIGSRHGSGPGVALGAGAGVAMLGGAVFYGWHRQHHPHEHPYP